MEQTEIIDEKERKEIVIPFQNGDKPTVEDFKKRIQVPAQTDPDGEIIEPAETVEENTDTIDGTDKKGNDVKYVLLSDLRIACVREGKGSHVERATMEAKGDQSKYLTSMMSACITISDKPVNMYDISSLKMKDYMKLQIAFSELNF